MTTNQPVDLNLAKKIVACLPFADNDRGLPETEQMMRFMIGEIESLRARTAAAAQGHEEEEEQEVSAKTIRETTLGCGTSLADVPADATLYAVNVTGSFSQVRNVGWNVLLIGETSETGPRFVIGEEARPVFWECSDVFYNIDSALRAAKERCKK